MKNRLLTILLALLPLVTWGQGMAEGDNGTETVAAPTFRFDGNSLVIETETEGASIFYLMEELPNMDEATIEKISSGMTVTADVQQSIYYEQPIEITKSVIVKAIAAGAALSEESTLIYDYDTWQDLLKAVEYGTDVYSRASNDSRVDSLLLEELQWLLEEGEMIYGMRASMDSYEARHFSENIMEVCQQLEAQMAEDSEPEPYAVLSDNNTVLTFYYDEEKQNRGGMDVAEWWAGYEDLSWHQFRETITNVVFDSTFVNCTTITSAAYWFCNCVNMTTISGLQYFNTENIQYMGSMFEGCHSLTDLDISGFNTAKVTDMWNMFKDCPVLTSLDLSSFNTSAAIAMNNMFDGCTNLKTIYAGSDWSTASVTEGANMFAGCTSLVGGAGTVYDANHTDYTYAHIDGGENNPGYFTDKNAPVPVPEPTFDFDDNGVLKVWGDMSLADALEAAGGRDEVAKTITAIVWNNETALTNSDLQGLDNPNMLIYVGSSEQAPANRDNVVVGDFAAAIVLTDVTEGNGNFYCPQEFKAGTISYTRHFGQQTEIGVARGWESIALPFSVQTVTHETQGVIAPFGNTASSKHFWLRQLTQQGLNRATTIEANWPYLISMPNSEAYPDEFNLAGSVTFSSQDALVPVTQPYAMEMWTEGGEMVMMCATFQSVAVDAMVYALNVGEQLDDYPEGSVFESNYRTVKPFEVYTVHEGGQNPAPRFIAISDLKGADLTGIESVTTDSTSKGEGRDYYMLNGRKLQGKPAVSGLYIHDGKKIVVK